MHPGVLLCGMVPVAEDIRQKDGESFVLRLWLESTDSESPDWRWQVHHVQSGEQRYFLSVRDVLEFVGRCAETAPPQVSLPAGRG